MGLRGTTVNPVWRVFRSIAHPSKSRCSDAFIVRRGDSDELGVESHVAAFATISLYKQHNFPPGTPLMIADANCRYVGLFQVSSPNANALPAGKIVQYGRGNQ